MKGIIYKYISPNNKVYIGQTLNEERRRKEFLNLKKQYGGLKINNARKKYKPENFEYEILFEKEYSDIEIANNELNILEEKYIKEYDSINNGYNTTLGGDSIRGVMLNEDCKQRMINTIKKGYEEGKIINPFKNRKHTEKTKEILREKSLGRTSSFKGHKHTEETKVILSECHSKMVGEKNSFYGKKHTEETKKTIGLKNSKSVVQIDKNTNEILNIFKSCKDAALFLNKPKGSSEIIRVCKNSFKTQNGYKKYNKTAYGFKWKYLTDIERSTTIEEVK